MSISKHVKHLSRLAGIAALAGGVLITGTSTGAGASAQHRATVSKAAATTYTTTTLDDSADPTFNQLLGINDQQVIAGYFGKGSAKHPNKGYTIVPPYAQGNYRNENFPGSVQTQVTGLNDFGTTVGFYVDGTGANIGFVDSNGTFTSVADPLSTATPKFNQLLGINNNGVAVGFYTDSVGNSHGYTYDVATKMFTPVPNFRNSVNEVATGINDQGDISGFFTRAKNNASVAFLLRNGTFTQIAPPAKGDQMQAFGVNDLRQVVGAYTAGAASHGFVWDGATNSLQTVDDPNGVGTTLLNGINNGGSIVGFYTDAAGNTDGFVGVPPVN